MNKTDAMKLLAPGDTVLFVLKNRDIRPLIITKIEAANGNINGTLHFDGPNDAQLLDAEIRSEQLRTGTLWVEDIPYSEATSATLGGSKTLVPGTWHLPERMAAAAGGT